MSPPLLGCIADDFTGATDLANNLVRAGMRAVQTIGVSEAALDSEADAVVVALKSRTVAPQEAVAQSLAALHWLRKQGAQQIYFKYCSTFDSTAHGNIGPVIDALLDALGAGSDHAPAASSPRPFTIACPAFPENQRTVFKGHLFVGDQLLSDSGMRHHPLTPMTDANLVRVLQQQTARKVGLVAYDVVARGAQAIRERFAALQAEGVQIAIVDAISNDDLVHIGAALAGMPLVTAGSGIAIGLPQNWRAGGALARAVQADALPPPSGQRAIVSGSCSLATNAQVLHFKRAGRPSFAIDPLDLAAGANVVGQALDWANARLTDSPVLIYATAETATVKTVQTQLGVAHAGAMIEDALSRIAAGLVRSGVRQLVVAVG